MLVLVGFREAVINAIPHDLKLAIGIGIGLFITIIGLVDAGIVVKGQGTVVTIAPKLNTWAIASSSSACSGPTRWSRAASAARC